jgi:hypothetical protein
MACNRFQFAWKEFQNFNHVDYSNSDLLLRSTYLHGLRSREHLPTCRTRKHVPQTSLQATDIWLLRKNFPYNDHANYGNIIPNHVQSNKDPLISKFVWIWSSNDVNPWPDVVSAGRYVCVCVCECVHAALRNTLRLFAEVIAKCFCSV